MHINLYKFVHASFIKINFTPYLLEWDLSLCEDDLTDSASSLIEAPYHVRFVLEHMHVLHHEKISLCPAVIRVSLLSRSNTITSTVDWNRGN